MLLAHDAVIAVIDGAHGALYRNAGNEANPELTPLPAPKLHAHNKSSGARHVSSSANHADRQLSEDAHAAALAEWLNAQVLTHKVSKLVVIAPPRTLGEMRRQYSGALTAVLVGELAKEMTSRTPREILEAVRAQRA